MDDWLEWCLDFSSGHLVSLHAPVFPAPVSATLHDSPGFIQNAVADHHSSESVDFRCFLMECSVEVSKDFDELLLTTHWVWMTG